MHKIKVLHILRGNAFVIDRSLSKSIPTYGGAEHYFALRDIDGVGVDESLRYNKTWIEAIPRNRFKGVICKSIFNRGIRGYFSAAVACIFPDFKLGSLLRLIFGPSRLVFHGSFLKPSTICILKFFRKKITIIHWGGSRKTYDTLLGRFEERGLSLVDHIFVLMTPELKYFNRFASIRQNVSVLPYPEPSLVCEADKILRSSLPSTDPGCSILGNSCWSISGYDQVLNKMEGNGWKRIVCMLAYGEEESGKCKDFVEKWSARLPGSFSPWTEIVTREEYDRRMAGAEYYICPSKHQTGLGAIYHSILQGKTVVLRGDNYEWISSLGLKALNLDEFDSLSPVELCRFRLAESDKIGNIRRLMHVFNEDFSINRWLVRVLN